MNSKDIAEFAANWNINYPIDRWWRQKHNIAFGSEEHLKSSPIFMRIEFEEDFLLKKELNKSKGTTETYKSGDWLTEHEPNQEDIAHFLKNVKFSNNS